MGRWGILIRVLGRDVLSALLVLMLFSLNLGQASAVLAAGDQVSVTQTVYCGAPVGDGQGAHAAPCHACRPDLPAILPPQDAALAVCFHSAAVVYAATGASRAAMQLLRGPQARGPPSSI